MICFYINLAYTYMYYMLTNKKIPIEKVGTDLIYLD